MTRDQRRTMFALKRANSTGRAYTRAAEKGFHPILVELLADGLVEADRREDKFWWGITDAGWAAIQRKIVAKHFIPVHKR